MSMLAELVEVVIGVDTHSQTHTAAIVDVHTGSVLARATVTAGPDGYAELIRLPGYETADVRVDPTRGFGQPIFAVGGARVEDALSMFWAGESLADVASEFGVPELQLEDALRVATRYAA